MRQIFSPALLFSTAVALALSTCPSLAFARNQLQPEASEDFVELSQVSDKELSAMRGGFIDIHGMMIDFSFISRITIDGNLQSSIAVTTADLIQAALNRSMPNGNLHSAVATTTAPVQTAANQDATNNGNLQPIPPITTADPVQGTTITTANPVQVATNQGTTNNGPNNGNLQPSTPATTAAQVQSAVNQGIQALIPPAIIQNANNNAQIALQRVLNLNISNAAATMLNRSQFNQLALQNVRSFR